MALHKGLLTSGFKLPTCEKHFHDQDETWLILAGRGTGYWIDHDGRREEFELSAGDVWMIPAGYEHGSEGFAESGRNSDDFTISVFIGTEAPGCHPHGHYYVEKEGYIPSFVLKKTPTNRYRETSTLPDRMRTITYVERGKAELRDEPLPVLGPQTVLCRSIYTGLTNGTERNVLTGGNYGPGTFPTRYGYQNVGEVLSVGERVSGIRPGDVVFSGAGCQHVEYFAAPASAEHLLITLPSEVEPRHAALFGVASVAMHDVRKAAVRLGERVLVVGAGLIGQFTAQIARLSGAEVTVCDLDEDRLALAGELGAHKVIALTRDADSWSAVEVAGPFDTVFEDSGAPLLDQVIGCTFGDSRVLRPGGRIAMVAGRDRVDYSFNGGQGLELTVLHVSHFTGDDLRQVCRLTAAGDLEVGRLIRDVVPIAEAPAIYDRLVSDPASLLGTVFDWRT